MFKLHTVGSAKTAPMEYYEGTTAENIVIGELLKLVSGKLTACAATDIPEFVAVGNGKGTVIPVIRVMEDMEFEAPLSAAGTSLKVGDKVTTANALTATATTTSGVFMISQILGTAVGDKIRGNFRR